MPALCTEIVDILTCFPLDVLFKYFSRRALSFSVMVVDVGSSLYSPSCRSGHSDDSLCSGFAKKAFHSSISCAENAAKSKSLVTDLKIYTF